MAIETKTPWNEVIGLDLAIGLILAFLCARRATQFGRNPWLWGLSGFFFGPLAYLALLVVTMKRSKACATVAPATAPPREEPALTIPAAPLQDARLEGWYYVNATREPVGPLIMSELITQLLEQEQTMSTLVWHPDMSEWTAAANTPLVSERLQHKPTSSCSS
jgi:hypothetical protein